MHPNTVVQDGPRGPGPTEVSVTWCDGQRWGCRLPVFRLTSAALTAGWFFLFVSIRGLGLSWDTVLSSEQAVLQNPVTADGVGSSKQLPF